MPFVSAFTLAAALCAAPPADTRPNADLVAELGACADEACPAFRTLIDRGAAIWPDLAPIVAPPADLRRAPDELTRFWSIGLCAALRIEACAAPLERILTVGAEPRLRAASAFALADIRGPAATPLLLLATTDVDPNVRFEAASALGRLPPHDRATVEALVPLLADRDADVRRATIEAMGLGRNAMAIPNLVARLRQDTLPMNRGFAAIALAQLRATANVGDIVARLATETDPEALAAACWALGELGDAAAVQPLEPLEKHADARVQEAAREALRTLRRVPEKPPRTIPREGPEPRPKTR